MIRKNKNYKTIFIPKEKSKRALEISMKLINYYGLKFSFTFLYGCQKKNKIKKYIYIFSFPRQQTQMYV